MAGTQRTEAIPYARSTLVIHKHPDAQDTDDGRRILASVKVNIAKRPPSQAFTLVSKGDYGRIQWDGASGFSADALLAARSSDDDRSATDEAREWLAGELANGERQKRDLLLAARKEGIADRTIDRAAASLSVVRRKSFGGAMRWALTITPTPPISPKINQSRQVFALVGNGERVPTPDDNGVVRLSDGTQHFTPERIAAIKKQRLDLQEGA